MQRKGPQGGARLLAPAKAIGFGDLFEAVGGAWPSSGDKLADGVMLRSRADAVKAMNETTIADLTRKMKRAKGRRDAGFAVVERFLS